MDVDYLKLLEEEKTGPDRIQGLSAKQAKKLLDEMGENTLVQKKKVAVSAGTLPTHNAMFIFLLVFIVLLVGALSFFPALALGPIAEFFQMIA